MNVGYNYYTVDSGSSEFAFECHLPNLLEDIREIVDGFSQTDPQFRHKRLYTRLTVTELRRQLIAQKNYSSELLPGDETLRLRMNRMGFILKKVQKSKPLKKIPETNAIFNQLAVDNKTAHADETVLRISMDAKAVVKMGELSRDGRKVAMRAVEAKLKRLPSLPRWFVTIQP